VTDGGAPFAARAPRASLPAWLREGARTLALMRPRWSRLHATPAILAALLVLDLLVSIGIGRLYIEGGATFVWRAPLAGWVTFVLTAWACYVLRPQPATNPARAPSAVHLIGLLLAQSLVLSIVWGALSLGLYRSGQFKDAQPLVLWAVWLVAPVWTVLAELVAMMRAGDRHLGRRITAVCTVAAAATLNYYIAPTPDYWREKTGESVAARQEPLQFTQDIVEDQGPLLDELVERLKPQRPGIADMYTITFAPYEGEDVFWRESRMVGEVMAKRFDAAGRGLQLVNHREHLSDMLWATPTNLQRAIDSMAATMNPEEDVLFIHLTSHGASDGELAANFWPLEVDPVTPADLKKWLDEAGIKHRVISISACFAGNWIAPLSGEDTLVMTASDASHTSYGCGKRSALTFFGRAMYDEQLRNTTLSFEEAHAAARKIIDQREKEAGKDDGYSNPQIKVGSRIRPYLEKMRARLANAATAKPVTP
jgi:hypothetical protein